MQTIAEVMTRDVATVAPQDTVRRAAQMMDDLNVGALPVCDGQRLVGMITDRDIVVRAISAGRNPEQTPVSDAMSTEVRWCYEDQRVGEVLDEMGEAQVRRIPVLERQSKRLSGIVSLGDLATKHTINTDPTLERISTPSQPDRPH